MTYRLTMTSPAHRMLKKLPRDIRKHVISQAQNLGANPLLGEQLQGEFRSFRSMHITYKGIQYRVVYEVNETLKEIVVRAAGTRENFYKSLRAMRLKSIS